MINAPGGGSALRPYPATVYAAAVKTPILRSLDRSEERDINKGEL